jgi:hypothetical protein
MLLGAKLTRKSEVFSVGLQYVTRQDYSGWHLIRETRDSFTEYGQNNWIEINKKWIYMITVVTIQKQTNELSLRLI